MRRRLKKQCPYIARRASHRGDKGGFFSLLNVREVSVLCSYAGRISASCPTPALPFSYLDFCLCSKFSTPLAFRTSCLALLSPRVQRPTVPFGSSSSSTRVAFAAPPEGGNHPHFFEGVRAPSGGSGRGVSPGKAPRAEEALPYHPESHNGLAARPTFGAGRRSELR